MLAMPPCIVARQSVHFLRQFKSGGVTLVAILTRQPRGVASRRNVPHLGPAVPTTLRPNLISGSRRLIPSGGPFPITELGTLASRWLGHAVKPLNPHSLPVSSGGELTSHSACSDGQPPVVYPPSSRFACYGEAHPHRASGLSRRRASSSRKPVSGLQGATTAPSFFGRASVGIAAIGMAGVSGGGMSSSPAVPISLNNASLFVPISGSNGLRKL
jgi:hypothetical protein